MLHKVKRLPVPRQTAIYVSIQDIMVSPCAGAVGPAAFLSQASNILLILSTEIVPSPTFINVPAIILTILYKKPLPFIRIVITSSFLFTSHEYIVRTVVFTWLPALQKLLKSCSPTSMSAALCILYTSRL